MQISLTKMIMIHIFSTVTSSSDRPIFRRFYFYWMQLAENPYRGYSSCVDFKSHVKI